MKKRGQIAIFVIVAVVLVAGIALLIYVRSTGRPSIPTGQEATPEQFMDSCIREAVRKRVPLLLDQGGVLEPTDFAVYHGTKVAYSCKTTNYYEPCVVQRPRFLKALSDELKNGIQSDVDSCVTKLKEELQNKNYEVSFEKKALEVTLKPGTIAVTLPVNLVTSKNDQTQQFEAFSSVIRSPLYDLGLVAQEITSQEAQYCYFEYVGYSILYPEFAIGVETRSDSTKIYTITSTRTGETMHIAIRGCALPAGF